MNAQAEFAADPFLRDIERNRKNGDREKNRGREDASLNEPVLGDAFGPIAESGGPVPAQNQKKHYNGIDESGELAPEGDAAEKVRFFVKLRRESVFGDVALVGSFGLGSRGLRGGGRCVVLRL